MPTMNLESSTGRSRKRILSIRSLTVRFLKLLISYSGPEYKVNRRDSLG